MGFLDTILGRDAKGIMKKLSAEERSSLLSWPRFVASQEPWDLMKLVHRKDGKERPYLAPCFTSALASAEELDKLYHSMRPLAEKLGVELTKEPDSLKLSVSGEMNMKINELRSVARTMDQTRGR